METVACCVATSMGVFTRVIWASRDRWEECWPIKDSFLPLGLLHGEGQAPTLHWFGRRGRVPCRAWIG